MIEEVLEKLKIFEEDQNFKFDPIAHKYTYNDKVYTSVTQFISNFHEKFDSELHSKRVADKTGKEQWEILKEWKEKNDRANWLGTGLHNWIENYFNRLYQELPTDLDLISRINKFNVIFGEHLHKLIPIKFEIRVFSKLYPLAGMIDSLFMYKGKICIIDYKTNGTFKTDENCHYKKLLHPFGEYFENHINEYSIQISLYALILKEHGINVDIGYLLHIGPDTEAKFYRCKNMMPILEKYLREEYKF